MQLFIVKVVVHCSVTTSGFANVIDNPGQWTVTSVPIPPALWFFCAGLPGLAGVARQES